MHEPQRFQFEFNLSGRFELHHFVHHESVTPDEQKLLAQLENRLRRAALRLAKLDEQHPPAK